MTQKLAEEQIIKIIELKQREGFIKYLFLPLLKALAGTLSLIAVLLIMCSSWVLAGMSAGLVILSMYKASNYKKQLALTQRLLRSFYQEKKNDPKNSTGS